MSKSLLYGSSSTEVHIESIILLLSSPMYYLLYRKVSRYLTDLPLTVPSSSELSAILYAYATVSSRPSETSGTASSQRSLAKGTSGNSSVKPTSSSAVRSSGALLPPSSSPYLPGGSPYHPNTIETMMRIKTIRSKKARVPKTMFGCSLKNIF